MVKPVIQSSVREGAGGARRPGGPVVSDAASKRGVQVDAFRALDRRSLAHDAAEQLRRLILDGTLQPGDRLPAERDLSARLGVSRPTLREGVRALVSIGLVETRHGAGTFVSSGAGAAGGPVTITIVDLYDALELRLLLEPVVAERAVAHITDEDLLRLGRTLAAMEEKVDEPEAFVMVDAEFHRQIHVAAQSPFLLSVLDGLWELARRGRLLSGRQPGVTERTLAEHRAIIEALERRDPSAAREAMTAHLTHIRTSLIGQTT